MSILKVHHLNGATFCPYLGKYLNEEGLLFCHVLLVETSHSLVLVDAAFGTEEVQNKDLLGSFRFLARPRISVQDTLLSQVASLGYDPHDVRHIVLTHLDLDHAGGISDFPWADIHVHEQEYEAAIVSPRFKEKYRYKAYPWRNKPKWNLYSEKEGDMWRDFAAIRPLEHLKEEIFMIPLHGHSRGHSGVVLSAKNRVMVHAGDAYFHREEMNREQGITWVRFYERGLASSWAFASENQNRLRMLKKSDPSALIFCAHDPEEFRACQNGKPFFE